MKADRIAAIFFAVTSLAAIACANVVARRLVAERDAEHALRVEAMERVDGIARICDARVDDVIKHCAVGAAREDVKP